MEGIITQRVTPILKCVVLFLFIFTAKVLTTRPQETSESKNGIQQVKPSHYVRTFTKYHHRRTGDWNHPEFWTDDHPKVIQKREADIQELNSIDQALFADPDSLLEDSNRIRKWNADTQESNPEKVNALFRKPSVIFGHIAKNIQKRNTIQQSNSFIERAKPFSESDVFQKDIISSSNGEKGSKSNDKNSFTNEAKKYKVKTAFIPTRPPKVVTSTISCLYQSNHVGMSATPSYEDDENAQFMTENESYDRGDITNATLENGETVQIEQCNGPNSYCYTLWHEDDDNNITIFSQGCWRSTGNAGCGLCTRTRQLPGSKFCCCNTPLCNQYFAKATLEEETATQKAESTMNSERSSDYSHYAAWSVLILLAILGLAALVHTLHCRKRQLIDDQSELEKGDVMGSGPDALATGLLCVDNLTLIEHIGQGKFGSVWRGSLGSTPVAVKLYSNVNAWQKEAAIYALPHLAHPNILRYYGSDSRSTLEGGRSHLIVVEACTTTLRARLERSPLSWRELADMAHGLAAALAHLHTPSGNKPCVVHRDVNTNNVLVVNGSVRLADLGLAQVLPARQPPAPNQPAMPHRIAEAGTLRYLAPEALEGALDLSSARVALCAVDVFALGLVLWEMLWRCSGAHNGPTPPYALPYQHHGLPSNPTLAQMQSLVSRNKARPPLPKGPVPEWRALKLTAATCDECWDHDAEARLTAVCVEERMAELKTMHSKVRTRTDNLHSQDSASTSLPESDKNSNVRATQCEAATPLLYPQPHVGRNACIERNTLTATPQPLQLIHKSLKDITTHPEGPRVQNIQENCLSVARVSHTRPFIPDFENSDRLNEIRSYQRPLEYIPNDVSSCEVDRKPKETNLLQEVKVEKPKWNIRRFFEKKLNRNPKVLETEVKLVPEVQNGRAKTSIVYGNGRNTDRPSNLILEERNYNFEIPCTLSPPNRTLSPTMLMESDMNRENRVFGFKELPRNENEPKTQNQIFAVIVPKAKPTDYGLIELRNKNDSSDSKYSVHTSMSSQSAFKSGQSESEDSTVKKRLSCENKISNSGSSSRASINLELQYIDNQNENFNESPFDLNSDCSSSEDEHLMLLSENNGSKITMQAIPKPDERKKFQIQNEVLKDASHRTDLTFNKMNKYTNFDNEFSDPHDKENCSYSGDNPVYLAALNGEIDTTDLKIIDNERSPKSPKPSLKNLAIKRQHSLEHVSEIFSSSGDISLQNPAGRVKTPGDLPIAIRRARRDRALQKGRANECNRLSLYDDRMMFGNSL